MNVGLVIGTYGTPAYVHLQLEARKRFYPDVPCLVHDDASEDAEALRILCQTYGAAFASTEERKGPLTGDNAAILAGFDWAIANGTDYLVKLSRRYLLLADWRPSLADAIARGGCLYSNPGLFTGPVRSECVGFDVAQWAASGRLSRSRETVAAGGDQTEVLLWRLGAPVIPWDAVGADGKPGVLPHLWYLERRGGYFAASREFGLPYSAEDFGAGALMLPLESVAPLGGTSSESEYHRHCPDADADDDSSSGKLWDRSAGRTTSQRRVFRL
jgi:hypothetical protein